MDQHSQTRSPAVSPDALTELAGHIRAYAGLRAKEPLHVVSDIFGATDWLSGPGDDGAAVPFDDSFVVACGEALLPGFVARDPFGAGIAAVLANVNDLAAMGARPVGIVDTIVADEAASREILRGIRHGCRLYDVPLLGGHLTRTDGPPALSAFGIGRAERVLSMTHVAAGQTLVLACAVEGEMRSDFPFFRGFDERGKRAAGDVRLLADLAESGACVAAKDVSMAGIIGSLAMLLEQGKWGIEVDLDEVPCPDSVPSEQWLTCFPNYAFLLAGPTGRVDEVLTAFRARGLEAAAIGVVDDSGSIRIASAGHSAAVLDLTVDAVTGLR
jgi:selenophosphate synthetase-related protein